MVNGLLAISSKGIDLILYYGGCALLFLLAIALFFVLKQKRKKDLKLSTLKKSCLKAKKYAEKLLHTKNEKISLLASSRLLRLSGMVEDATWYAYEISESKKDVSVEEIFKKLDSLASELVNESEDGYIPTAEYLADLERANVCLKEVLEELNTLLERK